MLAVIVALVLIAGSFVGGLALGKQNKSSANGQRGVTLAGADSDVTPSAACLPADSGRAGAGHFRFNTGACENGTTDVTAFTLPLHKGTHKGQTVWYVIMDVSDEATALRLGVNFAPKLANAKGTAGVQKVTVGADGTVDFPGTVDFKRTRVLTAGPNGFPPAPGAQPPSVGDSHYTPLIQLPNGTVENAPQVANDSGKAHKVLKLDTSGMKVLFRAQNGFYENKAVHYASFDSSDATVAAIEDVTYAPLLKTIPGPNDEDVKTSAREQLIAFINGPSGPFGQGVNYALQTGGANPSPKNLLHETPQLPHHDDVGSLDYTPMWDVHLAEWTQAAIDAGARVQMRDVNTVLDQKVKAQAPDPALVTGPGGKPYGAANVIVNCPLVSIDIP
ncbi:MAG: hypothetical protein DLM58_23705 [Pseudonocardiales bacterium]|nr:MAG: hypothetical protein DLM58_23705 [Pseudonocardiales bacterium]